jgi:hypothetical protein
MDFEVRWLIEDRLIYERFTGTFTMEMVTASQEQMLALLDAATTKPVHVLVDLSGVGKVAINPLNMRKSKVLQAVIDHPRVGNAVYVTNDNTLHKFFLQLLAAMGSNMKLVATMEAALDYMEHFVPIPQTVRDTLTTTAL